MARKWIKPAAIALLVVGVVAVGLGIFYAVVRASSLPSSMPGYRAAVRLRSGRILTYSQLKRYAAALLVLGAAVLTLAWWVAFRYDPAD
jgi:hypothetical protein